MLPRRPSVIEDRNRRPSILEEGKRTLIKLANKFRMEAGQNKENEENHPELEPVPRMYTQENPLVVEFVKRIRGLGPDYEPYAVTLESAVKKPIEIAFQDMNRMMLQHGNFLTSLSLRLIF